MPVFSYKSPNLEVNGAIIEVNLYPPFAVINQLRSLKQIVPTKKLIGLIDTGASCSAFDAPIAQELNLIVRDKQAVLTPSGVSEHYLYDVVTTLGDARTGISIQAFGADLTQQAYDILVGRDILRSCTLIYNGWNDSYDLHLHEDHIRPVI